MKKIRVLVVDDSALMRKLISQILMKDPELEVVNTAMDGMFALRKIQQKKPDVITLDLEMPRMDGLTALRYIVDDYGIPVVIVSSHTPEGGNLTLEGLALGAVDFVTKPREAISQNIHLIGDKLIKKVKLASRVSVRKPLRSGSPRLKEKAASPEKVRTHPPGAAPRKVIAIGISTGGPNAISYILPQLPEDFPAALVIVQHMPEGFTTAFANRLNTECRIRVREAHGGDRLLPGTALIAPGNKHLRVTKDGRAGLAVLSQGPSVSGHRPSADVLFDSVAQEYGSESIGLIMTGMGEDGARGLGRIQSMGGYTLAQDEESCVVFGMPKTAIDMRHADEVVTLEDIPDRLITLAKEVNADAARAEQAV